MTATLAQKLVEKLAQQKLTLATAESCTGGLLAKLVTDISGSSAVFMGGVVSYSNLMKMKWLNVREETLTKFGAVSAETVAEMLEGIQQATDCDLALAVSGVAGPTGGSSEKPVGTVFIGWKIRERSEVGRYRFDGDRASVRKQSAITAFRRMLEMLDAESAHGSW